MTVGVAAPLGLVIEDHAETRSWLVEVLSLALPGIVVVGLGDLEAANDWLAQASDEDRARLRIVLIDLVLPDGRGVDLIRTFRSQAPDAMAVVATTFDDDATLIEAMGAGAQGFLLKHHDGETLVRCIRRMEDGEPPLTPSIARRILAHFQARTVETAAPEPEEVLTPREVEVLSLLGRGSRVPEVAARLGLTDQTVATYVKIIYRKLRISSRAEAALAAARRGLV